MRVSPRPGTRGLADSCGMDETAAKDHLHHYLRAAREALFWKLEGLSEYDARRPLTPTGTNLLGLVKHVASMGADYFGLVFERPFPVPMPWLADDAEENADLWARADESRADVTALWEQAWAHADATIEALDLDAPGRVPWWSADGGAVTLHRILVHMVAETERHAGHADILRETIDGTAGLSRRTSNLPDHDDAWWQAYRARLEAAARTAADAG